MARSGETPGRVRGVPDPFAPQALVETYLAQLPEAQRARGIAAYLKTVVPLDRDRERQELLALIDKERARLALAGQLDLPNPPPYMVARRRRITLRIPLFDFSVPDVDGCSVAIQTSTSQASTGTWRVSIGIGSGGVTSKLSVSLKATFTAARGESKQLFLPVPAVAINKYVTQQVRPRPDTPAGLVPFPLSGQADVSLLPAAQEPVPAVRSIPASRPDGGRTVATYFLGEDASQGLSEYEYTQEATREYSVGAVGKIHDVGVDASASVALTKRLMLRIVLAGGLDYHLKALPDRPGLYWQY
jgi:hypothetical protein